MPHQHHTELSADKHEEEHAQADGLVDYLKLIFHTDLGEGHMERFESGKTFDFNTEFTVDLFPDLVIHYFNSHLQNPLDDQIRINYFDREVPILKKDVIAHLDFRGPPSIV